MSLSSRERFRTPINNDRSSSGNMRVEAEIPVSPELVNQVYDATSAGNTLRRIVSADEVARLRAREGNPPEYESVTGRTIIPLNRRDHLVEVAAQGRGRVGQHADIYRGSMGRRLLNGLLDFIRPDTIGPDIAVTSVISDVVEHYDSDTPRSSPRQGRVVEWEQWEDKPKRSFGMVVSRRSGIRRETN